MSVTGNMVDDAEQWGFDSGYLRGVRDALERVVGGLDPAVGIAIVDAEFARQKAEAEELSASWGLCATCDVLDQDDA